MIVGAVSILPILYVCLFFGFVVYFISSAGTPAPAASGFPEPFKYLFILHLLTMLLTFVLLAIYIVHAFRTDLLPNDKKAIWVVVLFFGSVVAMPIYWYFYMWRPLKQDPAAPV